MEEQMHFKRPRVDYDQHFVEGGNVLEQIQYIVEGQEISLSTKKASRNEIIEKEEQKFHQEKKIPSISMITTDTRTCGISSRSDTTETSSIQCNDEAEVSKGDMNPDKGDTFRTEKADSEIVREENTMEYNFVEYATHLQESSKDGPFRVIVSQKKIAKASKSYDIDGIDGNDNAAEVGTKALNQGNQGIRVSDEDPTRHQAGKFASQVQENPKDGPFRVILSEKKIAETSKGYDVDDNDNTAEVGTKALNQEFSERAIDFPNRRKSAYFETVRERTPLESYARKRAYNCTNKKIDVNRNKENSKKNDTSEGKSSEKNDIDFIYLDDDSDDSIETKQIKKNEMAVKKNLCEKGKLNIMRVRRINVYEPDAKEVVTNCRRSGTPVVLIGHRGWANFSRPWLKKVEKKTGQTMKIWKKEDIDLKNPNYKFELDVDKMIAHIGGEKAPIAVRNYDESNPIPKKMKVSTFLKKHWACDSNDKKTDFYLHQWQFPLSKTAGPKLVQQCKPLPCGILGEDILKYDNDENEKCFGDNPLQYIFMGKTDTMTKLHQDPGGLEITISTIVGDKECILVHRDDGVDCFYDCEAKLDSVDLHEYPLMSQARIWKTTIRPGDILLMPEGTYHQCRNITPCLSYSRFILDTVNLLPFYRSMIKCDAKEISHEQIFWNSAFELHSKISKYSEDFRKCVREGKQCPILRNDIAMGVKTLQELRHFIRQMAKDNSGKGRKKTKKGGKDSTNGLADHVKKIPQKGSSNSYDKMVEDIDDTIRAFQYRRLRLKNT